MSRLLRVTIAAAAVAAALVVPAGAQRTVGGTHNQLTEEEKRQGWQLLFDGKSLDGWRGYKRSDTSGTRWRIEDGTLTLPPSTGSDTNGALDIITNDTFERFELSWEWRVAPGANSGVKYFVLEDRSAAIGHEYQIVDDKRHPDAKVSVERQTASLYDVLAASDRKLKPAGEFNQSRVVVSGPDVEHWLNGTRVLTYALGSSALRRAVADSKFKDVARFGKLQKGHVLLQDHGDQVWYRNIKIRSALPSPTTSEKGQ